MRVWNDEFEAIVRSHLPLLDDKPLMPDMRLADLGLDSLATVSLLLDLEEEFSLTITDELLTAETFATAMALWTVVSGSAEQSVAP